MDERQIPSVAEYAAQAKRHEQAGNGQAALRAYMIATHLQILQMNPGDVAACLQLGLTFAQGGEDQRARAAYRAALVLAPRHSDAWANLGVLSGRAESLRRAVRLSPDRADYHANLAHILLNDGHFAEGFREWEWRTPSPPRSFDQSRWDGAPYPGKTLLVHAEQGFGDCIQFSRYLLLAARLGGRLIVEMRPPLAGLVSRLDGVAHVVPWGAPLPAFDLHLPLASLAHLFPGQPAPPPYLVIDPERVEAWRGRIQAPGRRKIGLVWAGNPQGYDKRRAFPFQLIEALVHGHPDLAFFSLQRDSDEGCQGLTALGSKLGDFDDVGAALDSLDLLISVDTAAAHLAAALGRETWVLLRAGHDWRWRPEWYPRARLYRQETEGDWAGVILKVTQDLGSLATK